MKKFITFALLGAITTACAKSPDAVAPVSMGNSFSGLTCQQARSMYNTEAQKVASLSKQQKEAQVADAVGVFFLLLPVGSLVGADVEGELATSKGKRVALENRLMSC